MSVYRRSPLIWNQQISYGSLFRRLPTELSHILGRSTSASVSSTTNSDRHQTNRINETSHVPDHSASTVNEDAASKPTRRERNRAERNRLAALRERLKNEDSLKVFTQFLGSDNPKDGFTNAQTSPTAIIAKRKKPIPYLPHDFLDGNRQTVYLETYGCQMNVNDSQIAAKVLSNYNYEIVDQLKGNETDIILIMTCSIREGAEKKIFERLRILRGYKATGRLKTVILAGCMASRLKDRVLERDRLVDIVVGPDNYRDLPNLLALHKLSGKNAVNVILSMDETYADVMPVIKVAANDSRSDQSSDEQTNKVELNNWSQFLQNDARKAFVSIMRGCDNMCSYCVVPYTRGRERSRSIETILDEVRLLSKAGVKEVTLLGQNVNSYRDYDPKSVERYQNSAVGHRQNFQTIYKKEKKGGVTFDVLLEQVARIDRNMRIRFTSPHPKDFTDEVIEVIARHPNICNHLHLPAQSGDDQVLEKMRRGHTVETYLQLVNAIRKKIPTCTFTTDFIVGFVSETAAAHQRTLDLMEKVKYTFVYFYPYSVRENTFAHLHYEDDVPFDVKLQRAQEVSDLFRKHAEELNRSLIGAEQLILIEGFSRKSKEVLYGRNESNVKVLVPLQELQDRTVSAKAYRRFEVGDYVVAKVLDATSQTLHGEPLYITTLADFCAIKEVDQIEAVQ